MRYSNKRLHTKINALSKNILSNHSKKDRTVLFSFSGLIFSLVSLLIAYFTLRQLIDQHKTSIEPHIVVINELYNLHYNLNWQDSLLNDFNFYFIDKDIVDSNLIQKETSFHNSDIDKTIDLGTLNLELKNIGLGTAKSICCEWYTAPFNLKENQKFLSYSISTHEQNVYKSNIIGANNNKYTYSVLLQKDSVNLNRKSFEKKDFTDKIDWLLPLEKSELSVYITVPDKIIFNLMMFNLLAIERNSLSRHEEAYNLTSPPFYLKLNYQDISHNNIIQNFKVEFKEENLFTPKKGTLRQVYSVKGRIVISNVDKVPKNYTLIKEHNLDLMDRMIKQSLVK